MIVTGFALAFVATLGLVIFQHDDNDLVARLFVISFIVGIVLIAWGAISWLEKVAL